MKVIAITNLKGGVAKTTTALNLAHRLAADGYRVLQLDLDHQANLTAFYDACSAENIHKLMIGGVPVVPQQVAQRLYLIPSDVQTATIDLELTRNLNWAIALRTVLRQPVYEDSYDFVIVDCPPALDMIVANALTCADFVLIPLTTGQFACDGLQSILRQIAETRKLLNPGLRVLGILLCMVSGRTRAAKSLSAHLQKEGLEATTCRTRIRFCEAFKQAELHHRSIFEFDPRSNGATDMEALYKEILPQLK